MTAELVELARGQRAAVRHGDRAHQKRHLQPVAEHRLHERCDEPLLVGHPAVALLQRAAADRAERHALQVIGQAVVRHSPARRDALQGRLDEGREVRLGVLAVVGLERHTGRQRVKRARLAGHNRLAAVVQAADGRLPVGRREKAVVVRAVLGRQQRRQLEVAQVVQAQHARRHPGDAAQLLGPLHLEAVDHLVHRQAHALAVAVDAVVGVGRENVHRHRAAVGIHLHAHDHRVGAVPAVVGGVDAVHVDQLQRVAKAVSRLRPAHAPDQKLAVARQAAHQRLAQVAQRLPARHVALARPLAPGLLDGRIGQAVGLARPVLHAHLQADAARADHVVLDHRAELARVVIVVDQLARAVAQSVQIAAQLLVEALRRGQPVGRQAVNARRLEAAHLGATRRRPARKHPAHAVHQLHAPNLTKMRRRSGRPAASRSACSSRSTSRRRRSRCAHSSVSVWRRSCRPAISYCAAAMLLGSAR